MSLYCRLKQPHVYIFIVSDVFMCFNKTAVVYLAFLNGCVIVAMVMVRGWLLPKNIFNVL